MNCKTFIHRLNSDRRLQSDKNLPAKYMKLRGNRASSLFRGFWRVSRAKIFLSYAVGIFADSRDSLELLIVWW
jgi:hypothetical protein